MAFDYDDARDLALELINEFGEAGEVIQVGSTGGYDAFGDVTPAVADVVISGIVTPILDYANSEIDGANVIAGDGYVYFHSDIAPEIDMQLTINSKTFRVINVISLDSVGGVNVYRALQLRS
jgi:hypothetical protein